MSEDFLEQDVGEKKFNMQDRWLQTLDNLKRQAYLKAAEGKHLDFALLINSLYAEVKPHFIREEIDLKELELIGHNLNVFTNIIKDSSNNLLANQLDKKSLTNLINARTKIMEEVTKINYYMLDTGLIFPNTRKRKFREVVRLSY